MFTVSGENIVKCLEAKIEVFSFIEVPPFRASYKC